MFLRYRPGRRAMASFGLLTSLFCSTGAFAADDIWRSTFGQGWFWEVRSTWGELMAGTWWESSLKPGKTYTISFDVQSLRGTVVLLVADNPEAIIDRTGHYSFEFDVSQGGKRRMAFVSRSRDVLASVNHISVTEQLSDTSSNAGATNHIPKGHYMSLARERDLEAEVVRPLASPWSTSDYHLNVAESLDDALRTPGLKGIMMRFNWRSLEVGDGVYDWRMLDRNMAVARKYGLTFIVQVADRSFDGTNILPKYFPSSYVLWTSNGGHLGGVVAKRWDPYVYNRLIRLNKAIANRYANDTAFGGIATTETATGDIGGGDYSLAKYMNALTQIITQSEAAMKRGRLLLYLNFLKNGMNFDMNKDARVKLLAGVPHGALTVGGPDITPDVQGMPRSVSNYRIHVRKSMPNLNQFCNMQHVDQGFKGINVKTNWHRQQYYHDVADLRKRESQWWYKGAPAVVEFDDLRDPNGNRVKLHPSWELGKLWKPWELFQFGQRNFGCDYVIWHYREHATADEFGWQDIQPVIRNNQYFYQN